jgi:predicted AlkP superfamily pyrophosphatase or phosphodiesterase
MKFCSTAEETAQHILNRRFNAKEQQFKPYLIFISVDGFRHDLADKYKAKNIQELRIK